MIKLATFGPGFGLPDPSPFVVKAEVLLQLSGLPFEKKSGGDVRKAPKGKLPYIDDNGTIVPDSTFIRIHLEKKYGVDFDRGLSAQQRGTAWAVEKMLEDQLYWVIISERWLNDANFAKGPAAFFKPIPAPIRGLVVRSVRKGLRRTVHGHGLGRHTQEEIYVLAARTIEAVANVLGENEHLTGPNICGADATVYAFMSGVLTPFFESSTRSIALEHRNIVAYCERMKRRFHPL
jgi:glutathione S-transferase